MQRSTIKKRGKSAFYRNWKVCIIICFIYSLLVGGTLISFRSTNYMDYPSKLSEINKIKLKGENNSEIVNEFIKNLKVNSLNIDPKINATDGLLASLANNVTSSGSFLFGILNALNEILFRNHIWASIIIILGALLSLIYWIFISKVLEVGKARFYLENRKYIKTKASKLVLPFKLGKTKKIALTMFLKNLYTLLWSITIVGPFIKYYSYILVPYILAENPDIKAMDAINLSADLMKGHKWDIFKLDLSFIGYQILGIITFNIGNLVLTNPYMGATHAEYYMELRKIGKRKHIPNIQYLNDKNLEGDLILDEYPNEKLKIVRFNKLFSFDYEQKYEALDLLSFFFIFSIIGYIWEVLLHLFQTGEFVNRGSFYGPWLPIYGAGCVAILIILQKYRKNIFIHFFLTILVCGIIEYFTSIYLEFFYHMSWWNYDNYLLNLNGRICLEGLLVFGIAGTFMTYIGAPVIKNIIGKIDKDLRVILLIILLVLFTFDFAVCVKYPHTGRGISMSVVT